MPFSYTNKSAGDLIRSQDWNAAMAAIAAIYDKLNAVSGHGHTGAPEDGPRIGTNGLADAAVTLQKLADFAVSTAKLQNGAVDGNKLAANSVGNSHLQNNSVNASKLTAGAVGTTQIVDLSVGNTKLADGSVTNSKLAAGAVDVNKLANGSVNMSKLATGTARDIVAVAVSFCSNGQTATIPSGFSVSECIFMLALSSVQVNLSDSGTALVKASINSSTGQVSVTNYNYTGGQACVLALARRGGWN